MIGLKEIPLSSQENRQILLYLDIMNPFPIDGEGFIAVRGKAQNEVDDLIKNS